MVADLFAGAVMMLGGGVVTCSSVPLLQARRRWRDDADIKSGLASAFSDTAQQPISAELLALLDQIP